MAGRLAGTSSDWPRAPAVPVVFAFAAGIVADRFSALTFGDWAGFGLVAIFAAAMTLVVGRSTPNSRAAAILGSLLVITVWVCAGGMRHHVFWSLRDADDVSACATTSRRPVRLIGRLAAPLNIDAADHSSATPQWTQVDRTIGTVACEAVGPSGGELPVSGLVRLDVTGHLIGPRVGDTLELFGTIQRPGGPQNPGGFDYAAYLRSQGIDAVLRVEHPDHVRVVQSQYNWLDRVSQWRDGLRREAEWLFVQRLDAAQVPLATSLLLGDRSGIDQELAEDFAESGTMHLLAISGLNVGIMAGLVHLICRLLQTGPRTTTLVLLATVVGYAFITDQRPPVLRAALLAVIVLSGRAAGRDAGGYQSLALCAIAILLFRPADLFDAGAQLSFLAVLAIVWSGPWLGERELQQAAARETQLETALLHRLAAPLLVGLRQAYVMTASIWLFTLPLTAWHFHLCSPVGLIVNVALIPFTTLMMAAGYLMLLLGLAHPALAIVPAAVFSVLLRGLLWIVRVSAETPLGHFAVPGPSDGWLVGFYLCLAIATGLLPLGRSTPWAWKGLGLWTAAGLAMCLLPVRQHGLRATFLSVGHGCAVLIEAPGGGTLLYDAGSFADGRRAQQTIQGALWERGQTQLDAVIVSHADVDHFNGLPGLVRSVPVGSVLLSPSCLDFAQESVVDLCDQVSRHGVPLRLIQAGDRLGINGAVTCEILHPSADFRAALDNANSVVVRIEYAGRSLLLTGDLEGDGLERLLASPSRPVDVLLSPHHGSSAANPSELAAWAAPQWVLVSAADGDVDEALVDRYGGAPAVLATSNCGAITVTINPAGEIEVTPFLSNAATARSGAVSEQPAAIDRRPSPAPAGD